MSQLKATGFPEDSESFTASVWC